MDSYEMVKYRPGRWAKIDGETGIFLGAATPEEVRAWRHDRATTSAEFMPREQAETPRVGDDLALDQRTPLNFDAQPPSMVANAEDPTTQEPVPEHTQMADPDPEQPVPRPEGTGTGPAEGMQVAWPLKEGFPITSNFQDHRNRTPPSKAPGTDFGCPMGTEVRAWAKGQVMRSRWSDGGGRALWIQHDQEIATYYAHLNCVHVLEGETVVAGQRIGETGNTGNSTGPHLHFSVILKAQYVDPERFLVFKESGKG